MGYCWCVGRGGQADPVRTRGFFSSAESVLCRSSRATPTDIAQADTHVVMICFRVSGGWKVS
jgi:hypothetical protein